MKDCLVLNKRNLSNTKNTKVMQVQWSIFGEHQGVSKYHQAQCCVFDISFQSNLKTRRKRRNTNYWETVASSATLFEVVGSLQSKLKAGLSEQQQGYLFQMDVVIPHKTSQRAHTRLANYSSTSATLV